MNTPNDFGRMGGAPSHPELLDWLATWFLENGGSFKKLHRLILTSSVYLQSSQGNAAYAQVDAENQYLWRMNRTRLDAESVRDSVLQVTGKLDLTMGGPPVKQFFYDDPNVGVTPIIDYSRFDVDSPASFRRSIYRYVFRTVTDPLMDSLDCPDASQLSPVRNISVTPFRHSRCGITASLFVRQNILQSESARSVPTWPHRLIGVRTSLGPPTHARLKPRPCWVMPPSTAWPTPAGCC